MADTNEWHPVLSVDSNVGELVAVLASHETIAGALRNLILELDTVFGEEIWIWEDADISLIGDAYKAFMESPLTIMEELDDQSTPGG